MLKPLFYILFLSLSAISMNNHASGTMTVDEVKNVNRIDATNEIEQQQLSTAAGLLAEYEILGKKLINSLHDDKIGSDNISKQAKELLSLSQSVIKSTQFRLPQCNEYLTKTLALKNSLGEIAHETLEKDYHHDGALPKAPAECYHTKDLFVHPATVIVLTRDDPTLSQQTKASINTEMTEVLAHTEVVRQLVIY